jgi:hypothetical protein
MDAADSIEGSVVRLTTRSRDMWAAGVHGAFVDGAGWEGVYKALKRDGYDVSVVQNTTLSLEDDDVHARYFGAELNDQSLTPGDSPRLAGTRFADWLGRMVQGGATLKHA